MQASRAEFLRLGAGVVGALAGGGLPAVEPALAGTSATAGPKPIPGGFSASFTPVPSNPAAHVFQPLKGGELNTIGDFNGFVAATELQGLAKGSDGTTSSFDCDMRFMQGSYVDLAGQLQKGSFGFI